MIRQRQLWLAAGMLVSQVSSLLIGMFIPNRPLPSGQVLDYWVIGIGLPFAILGMILILRSAGKPRLVQLSWLLFNLSVLAIAGVFLHWEFLSLSSGINWGIVRPGLMLIGIAFCWLLIRDLRRSWLSSLKHNG